MSVHSSQTPLINGDQVTFVWEGQGTPHLIGDFNFWLMERAPIPLQRVSEGRWEATLTLPRDAYLEYGLLVDGQRRYDERNPNRIEDGFGNVNSVFWMPDWVDTPLAMEQPGVRRGQITTHTVDGQRYVVGNMRTVHLYRAPVDVPTPLLVVFDGSGYLERAKLATIVDNLIAQGRIAPISMAMIDPGGIGRTVEYACSDATVAFIMYCVLPLARQHLNLIDVAAAPGQYSIMGASMGGLMSLYTALRAPEVFGRVLSESGAFRGNHLYYRSVIHDLLTYLPRPQVKVWMDCGLHEWYIDPNREMYALLKRQGYEVTYVEHTSGHNYPSWRNHVWRGIEALFGQ